MNCGYCKHADGIVYASNPPKYRCSVTGEYHIPYDDCNVEFEPVRHGHWIECGEPNKDGEFELWFYRCSMCGNASINSNYCPCCGAKMDGGAHE